MKDNRKVEDTNPIFSFRYLLRLGVCTIYQKKKTVILVGPVNGKAILVCLTEKFQNKQNVLRGSPKFPTAISKRKISFVPFTVFYQFKVLRK